MFIEWLTKFVRLFHSFWAKSLGGAKSGDPQAKTPDHSQAELGLLDMWPELGSKDSGEKTSDLES